MNTETKDLKNDYGCQKEFLNRNLQALDAIVGAVAGTHIKFQIIQEENTRGTYFKLYDPTNRASRCGVMSPAFKEVHIESFNLNFSSTGVYITIDCRYEEKDGGSNGVEICKLTIDEKDIIRLL